MENCIMEIDNVSFSYPEGTSALKGITLKLYRGKTTALLGGNGAGKSTLFLHMNGILKPSVGEIKLHGQQVVYTKEGLISLRRRVGLVFQDPDNQLFSASVYQDVSFGPMNLKLSAEEVRRRTEEAITRTGVDGLRDRPTHQLSYGQKKRVAIAGVIAMEPEILILDEPTAGLDPEGISDIMGLLKELQEKIGLTIVISTHDIDMVPLYADYVVVMKDGQIVMEGAPDQVFEKPKTLRNAHLRLPRIAHLMEILRTKDHFQFDKNASTIAEARRFFVKWRENHFSGVIKDSEK